jgi:drug/metabolite transporter (DMT)-like permease
LSFILGLYEAIFESTSIEAAMGRMTTVLVFIVMTFLCWGAYGPVLHEGQLAMGKSLWRPFLFVGVAYFLVAVCVPLLIRNLIREEPGRWTIAGIVWSLVAGAVGALGSLGVLLAFSHGGRPIFVMPIVFGCAPVVNTVFTMWMVKTARQAHLPFFLGILLVALGAAGVLRFKPSVAPNSATTTVRIQFAGQTPEIEGAHVANDWLVVQGRDVASVNQSVLPQLLEQGVDILGIRDGPSAPWTAVFYIVLTAICWGIYGPLLHKGQAGMEGSRLRPFICVGIAYFFLAILIPSIILYQTGEQGSFSFSGSLWSLVAGTLGAVGALGVIMAFNNGGRPVMVMPLIFGGAPVVNTLVSMLQSKLSDGAIGSMTPPFLMSLGFVIAGAAMVLVFAPRPAHAKPPANAHGVSGRESSESSTREPNASVAADEPAT